MDERKATPPTNIIEGAWQYSDLTQSLQGLYEEQEELNKKSTKTKEDNRRLNEIAKKIKEFKAQLNQ